ncbi:hypothetical protein NL676_033242 [Syzygium grande]|nr:hypothetical protein NL676_033242 [Syzygium grande]
MEGTFDAEMVTGKRSPSFRFQVRRGDDAKAGGRGGMEITWGRRISAAGAPSSERASERWPRSGDSVFVKGTPPERWRKGATQCRPCNGMEW